MAGSGGDAISGGADDHGCQEAGGVEGEFVAALGRKRGDMGVAEMDRNHLAKVVKFLFAGGLWSDAILLEKLFEGDAHRPEGRFWAF